METRFKSLLVVGALAALGLPATAGGATGPEADYSAEHGRCLSRGDAARGVSAAMAGCYNAELAKQDVRLNDAYRAAMAKQAPAGREALRQAQREWIRDRDRECARNLTGGTIDMVERSSCHLDMTIERARELERMAGRSTIAAPPEAASEARTFSHDDGILELLVIGPAARPLYERLPGKPERSACGAEGLQKGDGRILCTRVGEDYSCRVWLDARKQALAEPETSDC